jgi:hypothetical protein
VKAQIGEKVPRPILGQRYPAQLPGRQSGDQHPANAGGRWNGGGASAEGDTQGATSTLLNVGLPMLGNSDSKALNTVAGA